MSITEHAKSVWIVEQGEYSDYHIVGVYDSEVSANAVAAIIGQAKSSVVEYPLNPGLNEMLQGLWLYTVYMRRDGGVSHIIQTDKRWGCDFNERVQLWKRFQAPMELVAPVWARDEIHAVKIANEIRTRMIAEGEWQPEERTTSS